MNADWKVVVGTLAIFVVGLVAGVATLKLGERSSRPPLPMLHEFGNYPGKGMGERFGHEHEGHFRPFGGGERHGGPTPEMEKQLGEYHEKLKAVLSPYQEKINAVLTADQQRKVEAAREHRFDSPRGSERAGEPGGNLRFVGMIIYKPILERMSRDLQLDAKQQTQLDAIFKERRQALLDFLDANPPPTIRMALGSGAGAPVPPPPPAPAPAPAR